MDLPKPFENSSGQCKSDLCYSIYWWLFKDVQEVCKLSGLLLTLPKWTKVDPLYPSSCPVGGLWCSELRILGLVTLIYLTTLWICFKGRLPQNSWGFCLLFARILLGAWQRGLMVNPNWNPQTVNSVGAKCLFSWRNWKQNDEISQPGWLYCMDFQVQWSQLQPSCFINAS